MRHVQINSAPRFRARRNILRAAGGLAAVGALAAGGGWAAVRLGRNLYEVRRERALMQTSVAVTAMAPDRDAAGAAIAAAYHEMSGVAAELSRFDAASAVARLNREGQLAEAPAHLWTVLNRAQQISDLTEGDFDVTVLPVLQYLEALPRPVVLSAADRGTIGRRDGLVDYRRIALGAGRGGDGGADGDAKGTAGRQVRLTRPGMAITLDGIAKGYVVDRGIATLRAHGIEDALIDAGGEIRCISGSDPNRHWNVGIVDPVRRGTLAGVVRLRNAAFSTSGDYEVFYSADRSLFHIVNPHTGYSPQRYSSVTVMADESVETDAMSVAAFMMDLPRLKATMARRNHQWLTFSHDGKRRWRSADLPLVSGQAEVA